MKQVIKFSTIGLLNTILSLLIYYLLLYMGVHYIISNIVGYFVSSIWGYILNRYWVFQVKQIHTLNSVIRYYIVYGIILVGNIGGMYILVDGVGVSKSMAPFLTLCVTVPLNFFASKLWIYRR